MTSWISFERNKKRSKYFSGPFTEYKIVVVAITTRHDGNASTPIHQRTDVATPSPPIITNLACQKDGTILMRWKRPTVYYNTIDFYIVSYKSSKMEIPRQFQINASADHIETEVCNLKFLNNFRVLIVFLYSWEFPIWQWMKSMKSKFKLHP